jgi:thioredoxin reductase
MAPMEDLVIVGAGPYGLSLAAHLNASGISFRQFGRAMQVWRTAMPQGMFLKSEGFATNLSDPARRHTLEAFCREHGLEYGPQVQVALQTFVDYGMWFQQIHAPSLDERLVTDVRRDGRAFTVTADDGEEVLARRVVIATGVQHFAYTPGVLTRLPHEVRTHISEHPDLGRFHGREVVVVGAGQSALESAALLHETGATVTLVSRKPQLAWNAVPLPDDAAWRRLRQPQTLLGGGWLAWAYSTQLDLLRRMPSEWRVRTARTALGPAGAYWLRPRVEGRVNTIVGYSVEAARHEGGRVRLELRGEHGVRQVEADHVVAATGYRASLHRLAFLDEDLRYSIRMVGAAPAVDGAFQSSVPGLYFVGPAVATSFGPLMRFVAGTDYAARALSGALLNGKGQRLGRANRRFGTAASSDDADRNTHPAAGSQLDSASVP